MATQVTSSGFWRSRVWLSVVTLGTRDSIYEAQLFVRGSVEALVQTVLPRRCGLSI